MSLSLSLHALLPATRHRGSGSITEVDGREGGKLVMARRTQEHSVLFPTYDGLPCSQNKRLENVYLSKVVGLFHSDFINNEIVFILSISSPYTEVHIQNTNQICTASPAERDRTGMTFDTL